MTDWNDIFIDNLVNINIDILYDKWISLFLSIIDSFIPSKMVTIRPRDKPWMNGDIRRAMNKRNRLLNNFSKNKSLFNWENLNVLPLFKTDSRHMSILTATVFYLLMMRLYMKRFPLRH